MARLTLKEAAQAVGGRLLQGSGAETVERYAIDSRAIAGGEMFFALQGAHHDGHEFLGDVFTRGAAAAVVSRPGVTAPADRTLLQAKDTTRALQDLAAALRKSRVLSVVGITGSSGKTTTKELTAAVAATRFRTHKTPGNLNNTYGLPLAILGMPDTTEALVLEMGMSYPGEMTRITEIADPDIAAILNVSEAHRANFSSLREIARAKGELFRTMRPDATAVYNALDPEVEAIGRSHPGRRIAFATLPGGSNSSAAGIDLAVFDISDNMLTGVSFSWSLAGQAPRQARLALYGRHNAANAAAALAIGHALGVDLDAAAAALVNVPPVRGRGVVERLSSDVVLVDETYNSNPAAMTAVLASLAATRWPGRRVLAMGDMLELGDDSPRLHRAIGERARLAGVAHLIAVGPLGAETAAGFSAASSGNAAGAPGGESTAGASIVKNATHATWMSSEEAATAAAAQIRPGDLVIVKGSRGIAMEKFADAVRSQFPPEGGTGKAAA